MKFKDLFVQKTTKDFWGYDVNTAFNNLTGQEVTYGTYELFEDFLKKNPRFEDAEIVGGCDAFENDSYLFGNQYRDVEDHELWKVRLKGRSYAIGINRPYSSYWSVTVSDRMVFKRYYEDGETPIRKRRRNSVEVHHININRSKGNTHSNNCQILTLAAVTGADYFDVHKQMADRGWSPLSTGNEYTRGYKKSRWDEVLEYFGVQKKRIWSKCNIKYGVKNPNDCPESIANKNGMTVATAVKSLKKGKYVVSVRGHVCAVIDGKLYDGWNSSGLRVTEIYAVEEL